MLFIQWCDWQQPRIPFGMLAVVLGTFVALSQLQKDFCSCEIKIHSSIHSCMHSANTRPLQLLSPSLAQRVLSINCSQPRFFSGLLTAIVSGFLTYTFLQPLFVPVGLELAIVALHILSINAALVGMSLGVLLPVIFPGLCFGAAVALLAGSLAIIYNPLYFAITSVPIGVISAILSARYVCCCCCCRSMFRFVFLCFIYT